jgi:hypothetical protein
MPFFKGARMARKFACFTLLVAALVAHAQNGTGSISGQVKDSAGVPQMGAAVRIFAGPQMLLLFTDANGRYSARDLQPGTYQVKVSASSFLPSLRENIPLKTGAHLVVNLTLNTLFEAIQLLPARRRTAEDDEDWKWTLRSSTNRPILRVLGDGPLVVVSESDRKDDRALKASVAFLAGSEGQGFGGVSDMRTAFNLESSIFSAGTVSLKGNVGYSGGGSPSTVLRAAYSHDFANGSHPEVAFTMRRFASPDAALHNAALQALALSLADHTTIGDFIDLSYGGEFQSIQFMGHAATFRPFGAADVHLDKNTVVEYRYATSLPNTRKAKGFDSAPADLSESGPRLSMMASGPQLERASHHEISASRRMGDTNLQVALFTDRMRNTALVGAGEIGGESVDLLPDVYSGTFTYDGGTLGTNGMRVVVQRKIISDLTGTFDYSTGGVLDLAKYGIPAEDIRANLRAQRRHAMAAKLQGRIPGANTRWIASYKWTNGSALTPVDAFNASAGQADPFLSFFLRQPLPGGSFLPGKMEALVDVSNLLAQGYVPVMGQDGHTLYLVQSARTVRGGLAFTF